MCVDVFVWVKPLKDKKIITVRHGFIKVVKESKLQSNKLWVDEGREFYISPEMVR